MTGREWATQLSLFVASLVYTVAAFLFGFVAGQVEPGNFNPDVLLDVSQVEIRPLVLQFMAR